MSMTGWRNGTPPGLGRTASTDMLKTTRAPPFGRDIPDRVPGARYSRAPMASSGIAKRRAAAKAEGSSHYTARRLEIIRTAAEVFKTKGLAATSVDDIAKAAG